MAITVNGYEYIKGVREMVLVVADDGIKKYRIPIPATADTKLDVDALVKERAAVIDHNADYIASKLATLAGKPLMEQVDLSKLITVAAVTPGEEEITK